MLRTVVLLATHLSMLACGVGLAAITLRGRRQELAAKAATLDTRELIISARIDRLRAPAPLATQAAGRHRAKPRTVGLDVPPRPFVVPEPPKLATAGLADAVVLLATQRAVREQERRAFVDLMLGAGMRTWVKGSARVAVPA